MKEESDPLFYEFQRSLPFDIVLLREEIEVARGWVAILRGRKLLTAGEAHSLTRHLNELERLRAAGKVPVSLEIEDVHSLVENYLTEKAGAAGKKLHTGRSRNELAPAVLRLHMMRIGGEIRRALLDLLSAALAQAEANLETLCPFYTHQQRAEPVRLSYLWLAHFFQWARDLERLDEILRRFDLNPMGSGAGAGSSIALDRAEVERRLGFSASFDNALDATTSRDFVAEFLAWAALLMTNLSAIAQEIILWTSSEYGWAALPDSLVTGSSLLPHKRNADGAELVRSKAGRVLGHHTAFLASLKGLPLGYSKDLQEDKEHVLDTERTVLDSLRVMTKMVARLKFKPEAMRRALDEQFLGSVALIDALVASGVPFRDAYDKVAAALADSKGSVEALEAFRGVLPAATLKSLKDHRVSVEHKKGWGGTSLRAVRAQIQEARRLLSSRR